jgi:exopolyphosphatase/guanosine-5'-triphosphate,3'-diphosphate pyrophosphatase
MPERLALLEFGSNAARFVLASVRPGRGFRVLREDRVQTRLAAGRGRLPARSVEATVQATRRFLRGADTGCPIRVVAVATGAVRDAANAHRFVTAVRAIAGVDIEVLDWKAEAALGAAAAMASVSAKDALVVDVGGASVQATRVHHGAVTPLATAPLGAVRASRLFRHDPPAASEIGVLRRQVAETLGATTSGLAHPTTLIALGGTARALARMHLAARRSSRGLNGLRLNRDVLAALCARLQHLSLRRRRRLPGLRRDRADIIVAGAVVLDELLSRSGLPFLTVCERGVRHGLLLRETFGLERNA